MKKAWIVLAVLSVFACGTALAADEQIKLSGPHFTLNVIGVDKSKNPPMNNNDRHTMFVALGSRTGVAPSSIYLQNGYDFKVCDGNGFDSVYDCSGAVIKNSPGASFQLPCNTSLSYTEGYGCPGEVAQRSYKVYARALGKPGGETKMMTCAYDATTSDWWCATENILTLSRTAGKPVWKDSTSELTSFVYDINADGKLETVALFSSRFEEYMWQYDNYGLKHAQLRFYPLD